MGHWYMAVTLLLATPGVVVAQSCLGHTPFDPGTVKVGAVAEFGNGATSFRGGAAMGRADGWFAGASLGLTSGDGESGTLVAAEMGRQLARRIAGRLVLCPMVRVGLQFGPGEYHERNFIAAAMAGLPLPTISGSTAFSLVGGVQLAYQVYSGLPGSTGERRNFHDGYGLLDLGIGITFHNRLALVPQIRFPVEYQAQHPSFILRGSVNLGGSR